MLQVSYCGVAVVYPQCASSGKSMNERWGGCLAILGGRDLLGAWLHRRSLHRSLPSLQRKGLRQVGTFLESGRRQHVGRSFVGPGACKHRAPLTWQELQKVVPGTSTLWQPKYSRHRFPHLCLEVVWWDVLCVHVRLGAP